MLRIIEIAVCLSLLLLSFGLLQAAGPGGEDPQQKARLRTELKVEMDYLLYLPPSYDRGVPLERSQAMVDALEKNGGNVKFTVYPDAGHDSWTETYNNPELYEWLLEQRRNVKEPDGD